MMKGDGIPPHPSLLPLLLRKDFLDEVLAANGSAVRSGAPADFRHRHSDFGRGRALRGRFLRSCLLSAATIAASTSSRCHGRRCEPLRHSPQTEKRRRPGCRAAENTQDAPPQASRAQRDRDVARTGQERQADQSIVENAAQPAILPLLVSAKAMR